MRARFKSRVFAESPLCQRLRSMTLARTNRPAVFPLKTLATFSSLIGRSPELYPILWSSARAKDDSLDWSFSKSPAYCETDEAKSDCSDSGDEQRARDMKPSSPHLQFLVYFRIERPDPSRASKQTGSYNHSRHS